jgi:mannose-6-phosphate isomerase
MPPAIRRGKEECWLVIDAEPGATLGVGFHEPVSHEVLRAAALDGSIEDMLVWHPVKAGDFFYIPANTVHAIGAGVSLIEIQQNSDITYRLYDYGRPRELHLDKGSPCRARSRSIPRSPATFPTPARWNWPAAPISPRIAFRACPMPRWRQTMPAPAGDPAQGEVHLNGDVLRPGDCAAAPGIAALTFDPHGQAIIVRPA